MSASLVKITPTPPTAIKLEPGREGKFLFTLESLAAPDRVHDIILQALLVAEDGNGKEVDWLVAGPKPTPGMSGGKTETVRGRRRRPDLAAPPCAHAARPDRGGDLATGGAGPNAAPER